MQLTCVLFCLENNSYISDGFFDDYGEWMGEVKFVKEFKSAFHFDNRQEAIDFLSLFEKEILEKSGFRCFTPREYFKLQDNE